MPVSRKRKKHKASLNSNQTTADMNQSRKVDMRRHPDGTGQFKGEMYQGPLPHPDTLKGYQEVDPTLPNRIVSWMEKEGKHRRRMESFLVVGSLILSIFGVIAGLAAVAGLGYLSYHYMMNGNATAGASIAVSIASVVAVFVYRKAKKDPDQK